MLGLRFGPFVILEWSSLKLHCDFLWESYKIADQDFSVRAFNAEGSAFTNSVSILNTFIVWTFIGKIFAYRRATSNLKTGNEK